MQSAKSAQSSGFQPATSFTAFAFSAIAFAFSSATFAAAAAGAAFAAADFAAPLAAPVAGVDLASGVFLAAAGDLPPAGDFAGDLRAGDLLARLGGIVASGVQSAASAHDERTWLGRFASSSSSSATMAACALRPTAAGI